MVFLTTLGIKNGSKTIIIEFIIVANCQSMIKLNKWKRFIISVSPGVTDKADSVVCAWAKARNFGTDERCLLLKGRASVIWTFDGHLDLNPNQAIQQLLQSYQL